MYLAKSEHFWHPFERGSASFRDINKNNKYEKRNLHSNNDHNIRVADRRSSRKVRQ